ncbi:hypothetical protein FSP39_002504 [Pinctada imbricata]|uniref:RING-type E3 ubiquitin transferase n=1 Tax=Pinctada imbricata TaxID=66713 RepID=A0AA88Y543_PINIB|nr:hypothetical protein FSP39_002504 [Pinctada imbricata]
MDELNLEECICPICLCILIEPVTMPCTHTLCYLCFTQNVEDTSLSCPMCRTRISNWARRAAKTKTLINKKLWGDIQQCFPDKVKKRMNDCDDEDLEDAVFHPMINIAQPGEIRQEFEAQLKELEKQREIERRREQEASEKLIRKLQEEEQWQQRENKEREEQDLVLAQQLSKEGSPIMQRRLSELEEERKQNIKKLSKSTSTKSKSVTERTCNYSLQDMVDGCDAGKENNARGAKANENGAIKIEFENGQDFDDMPKLPKMIVPLKPNLDDDIVDLDIAPVLDDKSVIIVRSDSRKSKKRKMDHSPSLSDTALLQDQSILSSAKKKKKNHVQKLSDEKSMPKLSPQRSIMDWIVKGSASSALRNLEKATEKGDNETEDPLLDEGESFKQQCSVSSRIDSVPSRGVSKKGKISERSKNGNLQNKSYLLRKKLKHCRQYGDFIWDSLKTGRFAKSSRKVHKDSSSTNKNDDVDMCASIESNSQLTNKIQKPMDMVSKGTPSKRKVHLGHSSTISPHKRQKNSSTISPQKGQKSSTFSPHKEQNQRKPSSTSEESFLEEMSEREQQEYKDRMLAERLAKQYEMEVKMATQFYKMKGSDEEYNFRRKSKASTS